MGAVYLLFLKPLLKWGRGLDAQPRLQLHHRGHGGVPLLLAGEAHSDGAGILGHHLQRATP